MNQIRVILSDEAKDFLRQQPIKAQKKIAYNIRKLESGVKDKELFEKLGGSNIWEIRTLFDGSYYRLFSFWDTDKETLVVATHGFQKDTDQRDRQGRGDKKRILQQQITVMIWKR